MSLLKDIEELFAHSEQRVLAAFSAVKCTASAPTSRGKRKLPKPDGKPRVLCITAKRRSKKRGFKGTLHIAKLSQGKYQVRKSIRLKYLARIEAFIDSPGQQEYFELVFVQRGFTTGGETRLAYEVRNAAVRLEVLGTIYTFCRTHEKRAPSLVGIELSELEAAAVLYGKYLSAEDDRPGAPGRAASQPLSPTLHTTPSGGLALAGAGADGASNSLWAQREDRQLASLLEVVSVGTGSVEELQERLTAELAALEDASVHEILENGDMVDRVLGTLSSTLGLLDDLEENLNIFDTKLRHMREDISAIEDRNNRLELHSRNNQRLLDTLEGLVGCLSLSERTEEVLRYTAFNTKTLGAIVESAWDLQRSLKALSAAGALPAAAAAAAAPGAGGEKEQAAACRVPPGLQDMKAVVAQRQRLHEVMRVFLNKATTFLSDELTHIADNALSKVSLQQGVARLRTPDHSSIRRRAAELAPLLEVIRVMRPAATGPLRDCYCEALNSLLCKEVHVGVAELRRGLAAGEGGGGRGPDADLLMQNADSAAAFERVSSMPSTLRSHSRTPSMSPAAGGAARDGGPVHEAYESLLSTFLPLLAEEAQQCIALLFPRTVRVDDGAGAGMGRAKSVRFVQDGRAAAVAAEGSGVPAAPQEMPLDTSSPEVQASLAALLQGVEAEVLPLVDSSKPQERALLALPMLGVTLEWRRRLATRPACAPLLAMLARFEGRLRAQLAAYADERVGTIQRYDARGSMAGSSVKSVHVFRFIVNFEKVAAQMEDLLLRWRGSDPSFTTPPAAPALAPAAAVPSPFSSAVGSGGGRGPGLPPRPPSSGASRLGAAPLGSGAGTAQSPVLMPSPFEAMTNKRFTTEESGSAAASATEGTEISFMDTEGEEGDGVSNGGGSASGGGGSRRQTVQSSSDGSSRGGTPHAPQATGAVGASRATPGLGAGGGVSVAGTPAAGQQQQLPGGEQPQESIGSVLRELADSLHDRILKAMLAAVEAAADSDAKHGQRLRLENYYFLLHSLQSLPTQRVPLLGRYLQQVGVLTEAAMRAYIEQQVDYFKFTRILELSRKLDELMESVGPEEVPFQLNYQPQDVKQLLSSTMAGVDKKLAQVHARIEKHMRGSSPYLIGVVWGKLEGICLQRWARMQDQLKLCYPGITLHPPLAQLKQIFQAAARAGG